MKKLNIFVFFALFIITLLSPVKNVFADIPPEPKRKIIVLSDTTNEQDTSVIKDTVKSKQIQSNLNLFEQIQPQNIVVGGTVFVVVIFSFVILSKLRNKK